MKSFSIDHDFEELKKRWNAVAFEPRSHADLMKMTRASHHPRLRRLRTKLLLEICISFLIVTAIVLVTQMRDIPLWLTMGSILCNAFYLLNNALGYHYLRVLPDEDSIRGSIAKYHARMKRMLTLSTLAGGMMVTFIILADIWVPASAGAVIFFFFLAPLSLLSFWTANSWRSRAVEVACLLREFDE